MAKTLQLSPLLDIQSAEFAKQYEHGVFWAMHGDEQGNGPQSDSYLITNLTAHIENGHFHDLKSPSFSLLGFFLGMVHGGILSPQTGQQRPEVSTLVLLHDPNFTKGYEAGREWYYFEARANERRLNETFVIQRFHELATEHDHYREQQSVLNFTYGCLIGELSGQPFPMGEAERHQIEEANRQFMAEYEARHAQTLKHSTEPLPSAILQEA